MVGFSSRLHPRATKLPHRKRKQSDVLLFSKFYFPRLQHIIQFCPVHDDAQAVALVCALQQSTDFTVAAFIKRQKLVVICQQSESTALASRHLHALSCMFLAQIGFCRFTLTGTGNIDQVAVPPRARSLFGLLPVSGRCRKGNHNNNGENKSSREHKFIFTDCCSLPSDHALPLTILSA